MNLTQLPDDVLLHIGAQLRKFDCKNLRRTYSIFADIFAVRVLNSLTIDISAEADLVDMMKWLMGEHVRLAPTDAIRRLDIGSLSALERDARGLPKLSNSAMLSGTSISLDEVLIAILGGLKSLTSIHTLCWKVQGADPPPVQQAIAEATSGYLHLRHLQITAYSYQDSLLHLFRDIHSLEYSGSWIDSCDDLDILAATNNLGQAISSSPRLESLKFYANSRSSNQLEQLFAPSNALGIILPLRHITIHRSSSLIPLIPHLHNLHSLDIAEVNRWGDSSSAEQRYSDLAAFWRAVLSVGACLKNIRVDHVSEDLVEYLKWNRGLKSFKLYNYSHVMDHPISVVNRVAKLFYKEALGNHFLTLEHLDLRLRFEDCWCLAIDMLPTISQLSSLVYLGIGVTYSQLSANCDKRDESQGAHEHILELLIDVIALNCPQLRELHLYTIYPTRPGDPNHNNNHQNEAHITQLMWEMIEAALEEYIAPHGALALPDIYVAPGGYGLWVYWSPSSVSGEDRRLCFRRHRRVYDIDSI